mgnify:FL=1|jgi:hypothetical protein
MKIQAQDVKKGMEVKFGWGQWLKVESIETQLQKNGKELKLFKGSSKQEKPTRRNARKYPTLEPQENDTCIYKASTKLDVR